MKKAGLEIGQIYGGKYGGAYLLVSPLMWSKARTHQRWMTWPNKTRASKGGGYYEPAVGVLALRGSVEELRRWVLGNSDLLEKGKMLTAPSRGDSGYSWFAEAVHDRSGDLHLSAQNYQTWPGTYEAVTKAADADRELKDKQRAVLKAKNASNTKRSITVFSRLRELGITQGVKSYYDWEASGGEKMYSPRGVTLSLEAIEQLLDIEENE